MLGRLTEQDRCPIIFQRVSVGLVSSGVEIQSRCPLQRKRQLVLCKLAIADVCNFPHTCAYPLYFGACFIDEGCIVPNVFFSSSCSLLLLVSGYTHIASCVHSPLGGYTHAAEYADQTKS